MRTLGSGTKKRRLVILVLFLLGTNGCVIDGQFKKKDLTGQTTCPNASGYTFTGIVYGDSKMAIIPLSNIRAGAEWRFYLIPEDLSRGESPQFGERAIKIDGKLDPPPEQSDTWLEVNSSFNDADTGRTRLFFGKLTRFLTLCVPESVDEGDNFYFLVDIEGIGTIDPRARVQL